MLKVFTLSVLVVSAVGLGLLAVFGFSPAAELPLPEVHVGLLVGEMDRLDAAWAVFDQYDGAWVLQDDKRREIGRVVLND